MKSKKIVRVLAVIMVIMGFVLIIGAVRLSYFIVYDRGFVSQQLNDFYYNNGGSTLLMDEYIRMFRYVGMLSGFVGAVLFGTTFFWNPSIINDYKNGEEIEQNN